MRTYADVCGRMFDPGAQALSFPAVFAAVHLRVQNIVEATAAEELLVVRPSLRQYLYFCTRKASKSVLVKQAIEQNIVEATASVFVLMLLLIP